jgi:hypothetical protein
MQGLHNLTVEFKEWAPKHGIQPSCMDTLSLAKLKVDTLSLDYPSVSGQPGHGYPIMMFIAHCLQIDPSKNALVTNKRHSSCRHFRGKNTDTVPIINVVQPMGHKHRVFLYKNAQSRIVPG